MSWQSSIHARFLLPLSVLTTYQLAAYAQPAGTTDRVVAVDDRSMASHVVLKTDCKRPLPAPRIQYLPGPEGKTIFVADFQGVLYSLPTYIAHPDGGQQPVWRGGIQEIRVGQFQNNPPTLRISASSYNAASFKALSFQARPGQLTVSWSNGSHKPLPKVAHAGATLPPVAPPVRAWKAAASKEMVRKAAAPEAAARREATPEEMVRKETLGKEPERQAPEKTASRQTAELSPVMPAPARAVARQFKIDADNPEIYSSLSDKKEEQNDRVSPASEMNDDSVAINVERDGRVTIRAGKKLSYNSFRLHEPERYVVDFDNLPGLIEAPLPPASEEAAVKSLRVGTPSDKEGVFRLVLDLKDEKTDIFELIDQSGMMLSLSSRPMSMAMAKASVLKGKLIVVDAGHGGTDPGAQRAGIQEKELTLSIANALARRLSGLGAKIIMTRSDDSTVSLEDRVKITNSSNADLFLSVHINALESTTHIYGIETYYQTEQSKPLAEKIHEQLVSMLGVPDRFVRKARFYVINHTEVPAILAEVGYISNKAEREKLISSDYQTKIGDAISEGVVLYLSDRRELADKGGVASK